MRILKSFKTLGNRPTFRIVGGTAGGQTIAFVASLVIVRLYSPAEFGTFTTLTAICAILVPLATGRLELAIPISKDEDEASRLMRMTLVGVLTSSILITAIQLVFLQGEEKWWSASDLIWCLPALLVGTTVFQLGNQVGVRGGRYSELAKRGFIFPIVASVFQILFGLLSWDARGLILSLAIGQIVAFFIVWRPRSVSGNTRGRRGAYSSTLKRFWKFPVLLSFSGCLNAFGSQAPQILIAIFFGASTAGQFGLMAKVLALPVALIGQSIAHVYNGHISEMIRNKKANNNAIFISTSKKLAIFSISLVAVTVLLSPWAFRFVFGSTWEMAGNFAQLYAISLGMQLLVAPISQTLVMAEMQGKQFGVDLVRALAMVFPFVVSYIANLGPEETILLASITSALSYILAWGLNYQAAKTLDLSLSHRLH